MTGSKCFNWSRFYAYCVPLNQVFPFAVGIFYWHQREWLRAKIKPGVAIVGFAFFFMLAVASVMLTREYSIFYRQILVSCAFLFGLLLLERYERIIPNGLVWLGRHSYEIFILHFVIIWVVLG